MSDAKLLVIGASGLVGHRFVTMRIDQPLSILVRTAQNLLSPYVKMHIAHGDEWAKRIAAIRPDILVCAIGTTIKQVGGAVQFQAVDRDLVGACASAARRAGARQMIVISSVGANSRSHNFYLRTKGEMEAIVGEQGFARIDIFRPGLLIGSRQESRPGEAFAQRIAPMTDGLLLGSLRRYRSISADTLARAMWAVVGADDAGVFVHHHNEIRMLAD